MVHFTVDGARQADTEETKELAREVGADGESGGGADALLVGRFGARAHVANGEQVEVAVDTSALHFFDPQTGLGIYDRTEEKGATS
jgi:multiple sugar transport system ATP-binding protein